MKKKWMLLMYIISIIGFTTIILIIGNKENPEADEKKEEVIEDIVVEDIIERIEPVNYKTVEIKDSDEFIMEIDYEVSKIINKEDYAQFEIIIMEIEEEKIIDFLIGYKHFTLNMNPQLRSIEVSLIFENEVIGTYDSKTNILTIKEEL